MRVLREGFAQTLRSIFSCTLRGIWCDLALLFLGGKFFLSNIVMVSPSTYQNPEFLRLLDGRCTVVGRSLAAPVSSAATEQKKSFDRGGPV